MSTVPLTATVNGHRATRIALRCPWAGIWYADVDFDARLDASQLTGPAAVNVGPLEAIGTFMPERAGSFQILSTARVIGGFGRWSTVLRAKHYHSDAGVKVTTVVADAAREAGEAIATSVLTTERLGVDFVRREAPARTTLEQALGGIDWWMGYDGETRIGSRVSAEVTETHEILDYDPRLHIATVSTDDPGSVVPGSVLRQRLDRPLLVREVLIAVAAGKCRLTCWGLEVDA